MLPFAQTVFKSLNRADCCRRMRTGGCLSGAFSYGFKAAAMLALWALSAMIPPSLAGAEVAATGIIKASKLNMRSAPDPAAPVLTVLQRDTKVRILKRAGGWLFINYNEKSGYVRNHERYVIIIPAAQTKSASGGQLPQPEVDAKAQFQRESQEIQQKLSDHQQEVISFTKKEVALVESLNDIDFSIDLARQEAATLRSEITALDGTIKENAAASKNLIEKINRIEAYAAERLVALYKLNWLGRFNVLASAESMYELFQRKFALERILIYDDKVRQELISSKARLGQLQAQLQSEKSAKLTLEEKNQAQIDLMSRKRAERSRLLDDIRSKKSLELAAIETLKQSARSLDRTVQMLSTAEKRLLPEAKETAEDFNKLRGLLKMPVKGTIETSFGSYLNPKLNVLNFRSGIDIKADRGEPVRAVSAGTVIYASWFKGYGKMIIIDHGNSYYTVYAHVEEFFKAKGDAVEADEVIATAGDTGSMTGSGLYFEVRHHGKPLDPMEWIKRG